MIISRLVLLLLKARKRETALFLLSLCFLYIVMRSTCGVPKDIQAVVMLITSLLSGFF